MLDVCKLSSGCVCQWVAICHRWCHSSCIYIRTGKLYLQLWLFLQCCFGHLRNWSLFSVFWTDLRAWLLPVSRDQSVRMMVVWMCVLFHLKFYWCEPLQIILEKEPTSCSFLFLGRWEIFAVDKLTGLSTWTTGQALWPVGSARFHVQKTEHAMMHTKHQNNIVVERIWRDTHSNLLWINLIRKPFSEIVKDTVSESMVDIYAPCQGKVFTSVQ